MTTIRRTSAIRWNNGILEEAWQTMETGEIEWKPVPCEPCTEPTTEQRLAALEEQVDILRGFLNI